MKQDFFKYLPSEITTNIFSRLPIRTIARCQCVCKPWLNLLQTNHFLTSNLSKSLPTLAVIKPPSWDSRTSFSIFEFEEAQDLDRHDLHYNLLTKFEFPLHDDYYYTTCFLIGSANGLLFLSMFKGHYLCNPITREYVEVSFPREFSVCGFGVSKITCQYKGVSIFQDHVSEVGQETGRTISEPECRVHTLETGSWRRVEVDAAFEYSPRAISVFHNGNLHWVVTDSDTNLWISCFDLETECFSNFSTPPVYQSSFELIAGLSVLDDCLCLCDHTRECETVIWLMKEYGDEKSWTKVYAFNVNKELDIEGFELVYPIRVFEDGDVLMLREDMYLFYFSNKTEIAAEVGIFGNAIIITPSFVSLKSLGMENVISF